MPKHTQKLARPPKLYATKKIVDLELTPRDIESKNCLIVIEGTQWQALRELCVHLLEENKYDTPEETKMAHAFLNSMVERLDASWVLCMPPEPSRVIVPRAHTVNPDPLRLVKLRD